MQRVKSNLYFHKNSFYCRLYIPKQLQPIAGKKEVWKSLRTSDIKTAKIRLHNEFAHFYNNLQMNDFNKIRITTENIDVIIGHIYEYYVNYTALFYNQKFYIEEFYDDNSGLVRLLMRALMMA